MLKNKRKKELGAILSQEVIIWIIVIAGALAAAGILFSSNKDNSSKFQTKIFLSTGFVNSVENCIQTKSSITNCNSPAILAKYGADKKTAWDENWTLSYADRKFTVGYPLLGLSDPDDFGNGVATYLSTTRGISPTYNDSTNELTVIYTR